MAEPAVAVFCQSPVPGLLSGRNAWSQILAPSPGSSFLPLLILAGNRDDSSVWAPAAHWGRPAQDPQLPALTQASPYLRSEPTDGNSLSASKLAENNFDYLIILCLVIIDAIEL